MNDTTLKDYKNRYRKYFFGDLMRILYRRVMKKRKTYSTYAGRAISSIADGNMQLYNMIKSENPFLVMRYGSAELSLTTDPIIFGKYKQATLNNGKLHAGFFPANAESAMKFADLMISSASLIDMAALFYSFSEEFMLGEFSPNASLVNNRAIEPWYSIENPWSRGLKDKKVLIISPLADTIESQYKKRELLFPGTDILPEFELHTLKAVQTIAGQQDERFESWFDALDYMAAEASKINYDIAILGCGAYGYPLAAKLKASGKQTIHLGGATQLFFGIKGKRWDNHPDISKLYNNSWVRPNDSDKPKDAELVENGCYW